MFVLVIVVIGILSNGIGRITYDYPYIEFVFARTAFVVRFEFRLKYVFLAFAAGFERVRPDNNVVRLVAAFRHDVVICGFYVHAGDIVGERHNLVGVEVVLVLVRQSVLIY